MYFKINIILIILSYQCIDVAVFEELVIPGRHSCYVKMPPVDTEYMPLPFYGNVSKPTIIRPNGNGHYVFQHNTQFKLSCAGTSFSSPTRYALTEINVVCNNGFLEYRGRPLYFTAFKCKAVPTPSLKLTRMMCQGSENNSVLEVGFQTKHAFVKSYRICFDYIQKRTLFSWYFVNSPVIKINQIKLQKPSFIETRLFDGINMTRMYFTESQRRGLTSSLNSSESANKYLNNRFLTPGNLLGDDDFVYVSEQHATYFYENTAPHWSELNNRVWKLLERLFRRNLMRGTRRHMIAAGTYGLLMLPDENGVEHPVYLGTDNRLPVPKYIWKMDYDIDRNAGTVFIGYNHPHAPVDSSLYFCEPVQCPGELSKHDNSDVLFCCTIDSFEKVYGLLDHTLFRPF